VAGNQFVKPCLKALQGRVRSSQVLAVLMQKYRADPKDRVPNKHDWQGKKLVGHGRWQGDLMRGEGGQSRIGLYHLGEVFLANA